METYILNARNFKEVNLSGLRLGTNMGVPYRRDKS